MTNLNDEQRRAVEKIYGPVLVLAGPGSGKTHVLVKRIRYMIEEVGISPKEILVLTFSKKAAIEMQDRFNRLTRGNTYPVYFGTFHAVFFSIVKTYYDFEKDSVLTDNLKKRYLKRVLKKLAINITDDLKLEEILEKISLYKSNQSLLNESPDNYLFEDREEKEDEEVKKIYKEYVALCTKEKKLDFDDMVLMCKKLLVEKPEVLNQYKKIYKYILVDEFQDINNPQYEILKLLAGEKNNVFAVGDDDQSIYGFRGSNPELMKQFISDFDNCEVIDMNRNYRCAECIIDAATRLIRNNGNRIEKRQLACKENKEQGFVKIKNCSNAIVEADFIVKEIFELRARNYDLSNVAIIFRTVRSVDFLIEKLKINGIPFGINTLVDNYYESEWIKDIVAYIRVAININDNSSLYRILNRPERGLLREEIFDAGGLINLNTCEYCEIKNDFSMLSNMNCFAAVNYILRKMKYEKYLYLSFGKKGYKQDKIKELIEELLEKARRFNSLREWIDYIDIVTENSGDSFEKLDRNLTDNGFAGKIQLLTAHASKGLEYETVFVVGLQEGIFPHNKATTDSLIEEERRLLYVAITRAKKYLYIVGRGEEKYGKRVSGFINEILKGDKS